MGVLTQGIAYMRGPRTSRCHERPLHICIPSDCTKRFESETSVRSVTSGKPRAPTRTSASGWARGEAPAAGRAYCPQPIVQATDGDQIVCNGPLEAVSLCMWGNAALDLATRRRSLVATSCARQKLRPGIQHPLWVYGLREGLNGVYDVIRARWTRRMEMIMRRPPRSDGGRSERRIIERPPVSHSNVVGGYMVLGMQQ
ncbi:hypothetical protein GY45DRAFT_1122393 [Cubamyces sp. BRFM 1775]|nr:hypothetical protein GY45DRAFT_1122393 [Cubamyces sp. BRFM 1775]